MTIFKEKDCSCDQKGEYIDTMPYDSKQGLR